MYQKIVNPKTNRKVSATSKIGKSIIKSYYNALVTGGSWTGDNNAWENPLDCADITTSSLAKERPPTPEKPFNIGIKFVTSKEASILKDVTPLDTIESIVGGFLHSFSDTPPSINNFVFLYYPWGTGEGKRFIIIRDPKKYTMSMLRAGTDSVIVISAKLRGGNNRRKRPYQ